MNNEKIVCYYKRDRPYLLIAPIKVEIIHMNPLVVLFRNILSDNEVDFVISQSSKMVWTCIVLLRLFMIT